MLCFTIDLLHDLLLFALLFWKHQLLSHKSYEYRLTELNNLRSEGFTVVLLRLESFGMSHCVVGWAVLNFFKALQSFETSKTTCPVTQHHIQEDLCQNLLEINGIVLAKVSSWLWVIMLPARINRMTVVTETSSGSNVTVAVFLFGMFSMQSWKNVPISHTYLCVTTSELQF